MLAADADGLVRLFRSEVDDRITDSQGRDNGNLWKSWELYAYLTEAADRLLKDVQPGQRVLRLPYSAGSSAVSLPAKVLHIHSVRTVDDNRLLRPANANDMTYPATDDYGRTQVGHSALFEGTGQPSVYVRDYERRALRLVPAPAFAGTLELQVSVTVGVPIEPGGDLPTQDAEEQRLLLHFMKWRAYEKQDAETQDMPRAKHYENAYRFGAMERESALRNMRRTPGVIRMEFP